MRLAQDACNLYVNRWTDPSSDLSTDIVSISKFAGLAQAAMTSGKHPYVVFALSFNCNLVVDHVEVNVTVGTKSATITVNTLGQAEPKFALEFPDGTRGAANIAIRALDAQGQLLTSGSAQVTITDDATYPISMQLACPGANQDMDYRDMDHQDMACPGWPATGLPGQPNSSSCPCSPPPAGNCGGASFECHYNSGAADCQCSGGQWFCTKMLEDQGFSVNADML
jgi:hypothetical protein